MNNSRQSWIRQQPKNIQDAYRLSNDERAEVKRMRDEEMAEYLAQPFEIPAGTTTNGLLDL